MAAAHAPPMCRALARACHACSPLPSSPLYSVRTSAVTSSWQCSGRRPARGAAPAQQRCATSTTAQHIGWRVAPAVAGAGPFRRHELVNGGHSRLPAAAAPSGGQRRSLSRPRAKARASAVAHASPGSEETSYEEADHVSVLRDEAVDSWCRPGLTGGFFVDATAGAGGHTLRLLATNATARVLCIDVDPTVLAVARAAIEEAGYADRATFYHGSYADIETALAVSGYPSRVDGILLDLGMNSVQLDTARRGFSFQRDGPLDMRYNTAADRTAVTASDLVNTMTCPELEQLFRDKGEEPYAAEAAKGIVHWRGKGQRRRKIRSTLELRLAIETALEDTAGARGGGGPRGPRRRAETRASAFRQDKRGRWPSRDKREKELRRLENSRPKHAMVVRRVFQALRIAVNREAENLSALLRLVSRHLAQRGRLAVIAFHPAEDRPVVEAIEWMTSECCRPGLPDAATFCDCGTNARFRNVTEDPIRPTREEIKSNRRARSARLRVVEHVCRDVGRAEAYMPAPATAATDSAAAADDVGADAGVESEPAAAAAGLPFADAGRGPMLATRAVLSPRTSATGAHHGAMRWFTSSSRGAGDKGGSAGHSDDDGDDEATREAKAMAADDAAEMLRLEAERQMAKQFQEDRAARQRVMDQVPGLPDFDDLPYGFSVDDIDDMNIVSDSEFGDVSPEQWEDVMDVEAMARTLKVIDDDGEIDMDKFRQLAARLGDDGDEALAETAEQLDMTDFFAKNNLGIEVSGVINDDGTRTDIEELVEHAIAADKAGLGGPGEAARTPAIRPEAPKRQFEKVKPRRKK